MSISELQELINSSVDEEFLKQCVRRKTSWEKICIKKVVIDRNEAKKGDSYLSTIVRFAIEATGIKENEVKENTITLPVIAKVVPKNIARRKTFRSSDFFPNEIHFYEPLWSTLVEFIKSKQLEEKLEDILPIYLGANTDEYNTFIALENVTNQGFLSIDRSKGVSFEITTLILKSFAKFHAISFAYKQLNEAKFKELAEGLRETYFHERFRGWYTTFQKNLINVVRQCVEEQLPIKYLEAFDALTVKGEDFFSKICQVCAKQTPLSVICHGDAWIPNFLLKSDEIGRPVETLMIDFQLARCSSLVGDLGFFFYTCVDEKILESSYDGLLNLYLKEFQRVVRLLGAKPDSVTFDALKQELKDCGPFSVGMSMEGLVMSLLDDSEVADIDNIQGKEATPLEQVWILNPIKDDSKQKRMAGMIKHAVDNGYI